MSQRHRRPASDARSSVCGDIALIAAHLDGLTRSAEARAVRIHLATCQSCYQLVVESMRVAPFLMSGGPSKDLPRSG